MSVAKISEISCSSKVSFQDAVEKGIERANQTLHGIHGAWIKDQKLVIDNGKIVEYRANLKITFVLD